MSFKEELDVWCDVVLFFHGMRKKFTKDYRAGKITKEKYKELMRVSYDDWQRNSVNLNPSLLIIPFLDARK